MPQEKPRPKGLILHCGADVVSREEVYNVQTPPNTDTWFPMSHSHLLEEVELALWNSGYQISSRTLALSHENARMFGLIEVHKSYTEHDDYTWLIGVRNSHDKSIPAGVVAGSRIFVCDNLSWSAGIVKIQRKHSRYAQRDLRPLLEGAVKELDQHLNLLGIEQRTRHRLEK